MKKHLFTLLILLLLTSCFNELEDDSGTMNPQIKVICDPNPDAEICNTIKNRIEKPIFSSGNEYLSLFIDNTSIFTKDNSNIITYTSDWTKGWTVPLGKDSTKIVQFAHAGKRDFINKDIDEFQEYYFTDQGKLLSTDIHYHASGENDTMYFIKDSKEINLSAGIDLNKITKIFEVITYKTKKTDKFKNNKFYALGPPMNITHE